MADRVYYRGTMFEMLERAAVQYPKAIALDFLGAAVTYEKLIKEIEKCAKALKSLGVSPGDQVTIALPNCPQAVYAFYAVNRVGGVANMLHPLSAPKEFDSCLCQSDVLITLDQLYDKLSQRVESMSPRHCVLTSMADVLSPVKRFCYILNCRIRRDRKNPKVLRWEEFMNKGQKYFGEYQAKRIGEDVAVILRSGGTTGIAKDAALTNLNFNALAQQMIAANPMFSPGDKMLAAMPMFHGFGLGVCIHTVLTHGGRCVLIPRFTPKVYVRNLVRYQCNFIAGVPTLFEALLGIPKLEKVNMNCLKGVFCGGDVLTVELKQRIDYFLAEHKATVSVREGYGLTETVAACCLTPDHTDRPNCVGLPFSDTHIKIVEPGSDRELPCWEVGEILVSGPTVMQGYLNDIEETEKILQLHTDGRTWLRTGDLGAVDKDGYVYFRGRIKRMIVTSGYNVYPSEIEKILNTHESVCTSCVIGVPDAYKMQKVRAFVKLMPGIENKEEIKKELMFDCQKYLAHYAVPCDIVFRDDMPVTPMGKIDYGKLM